MSLTFGTIIADRNLQFIGLKSLLLGIFLSILFGFIFGLILGTTEMPWGYNDWPTDEMKGRYVFAYQIIILNFVCDTKEINKKKK